MPVTFTTTGGETFPLEVGCYIGGHLGQYASRELAEVYRWLDWHGTHRTSSSVGGSVRAAMLQAYADDDADEIFAIDDIIVDMLNEQTEGAVWFWQDGEMFLGSPDQE